MAKDKTAHTQAPTPEEYIALRRRRNYAVLGGIVFLCMLFYLITVIRLGAS
jgi:uncharacterized membrane protein (DUF485 family)